MYELKPTLKTHDLPEHPEGSNVLKPFGLRRNLTFPWGGEEKNYMFGMKSCPTDNKSFSSKRTLPWITFLIFYAPG